MRARRVVVAGWEDEDVLIVGYTEEPPRKRRKVTDEGVWMCRWKFRKVMKKNERF